MAAMIGLGHRRTVLGLEESDSFARLISLSTIVSSSDTDLASVRATMKA